MKNLFLFTLIASLFISSCKKDDDDNQNNPPPVVSDATFSCKVNGVNFVAKTVNTITYTSGSNTKIGCTAVDSLGNRISFAVKASTPGKYYVTGFDNGLDWDDFTYEPVGDPSFYIFSFLDTATVTFSSITNYNQPSMRLSGTFSFSVSRTPDNALITDGVFSNVRL